MAKQHGPFIARVKDPHRRRAGQVREPVQKFGWADHPLGPAGGVGPPPDPCPGAGMPVLVLKDDTIGQGRLGALENDLDGVVQRRGRVRGLDPDGRALTGQAQRMGDAPDMLLAPAGMDGPQAVEFDPKRKAGEPGQVLKPLLTRFGAGVILFEEGQMLAKILVGPRPQMPPGAGGMLSSEQHGVELVIAHEADGLAGLDHAPDRAHHAHIVRAAINEISQEQRLASGRVAPDAAKGLIAKLAEQPLEWFKVPVHIADQINAASGIESVLRR